jgi:hypothetical protein
VQRDSSLAAGEAAAVWSQILAGLEAEVATVESLVAEPESVDALTADLHWSAPADVPAIPASLAPRAEALLVRQQQAAVALTELLASNRQHVSAATGYTSGAPAVPLYWDHSV